ncbi:MAG: hypothetical protein ACI30W_02095 [Muribaculaceae bacterium]
MTLRLHSILRPSVAALMAVAALHAAAWQSTPLAAGIHVTDSIGGAVASLDYTVRATLGSRGEASWGIVWSRTSPDDYRGLSVTFAAQGDADEVYDRSITVTQYAVSGGSRHTISTADYPARDIEPRDDGFTIKLQVRPTGAIVCGGTAMPLFEEVVECPADAPAALGIASTATLTLLQCDLQCDTLSRRRYYDPASISDRIDITDRHQGYWTYFDRDTDPALASLGGSYELATVPRDDAEPGYFIIYLGGARPGSQWRPGEVKGILTPTIFSHHYDLLWLDAQGRSMTREQSATFDASGALLTLSFPLYKATVRFSRRPAAH